MAFFLASIVTFMNRMSFILKLNMTNKSIQHLRAEFIFHAAGLKDRVNMIDKMLKSRRVLKEDSASIEIERSSSSC